MSFIKKFESFFSKLEELPSEKFKVINSFTKKDYLDSNIETTPIQNLKEYKDIPFLTWFKTSDAELKEKYFDYSHNLLTDNRKNFLTIFGKPVFKTGDALEFNYHCWIIEYQGFQFIIMTANEKGTVIEKIDKVNLERKKLSDVLESFITDLVTSIKAVKK
jgi:hypothetical protein